MTRCVGYWQGGLVCVFAFAPCLTQGSQAHLVWCHLTKTSANDAGRVITSNFSLVFSSTFLGFWSRTLAQPNPLSSQGIPSNSQGLNADRGLTFTQSWIPSREGEDIAGPRWATVTSPFLRRDGKSYKEEKGIRVWVKDRFQRVGIVCKAVIVDIMVDFVHTNFVMLQRFRIMIPLLGRMLLRMRWRDCRWQCWRKTLVKRPET